MNTVVIKGSGLSLEKVETVAHGNARVRLAPSSLPRLRASRHVVERALALDAPAYGINTGLGRLSDVRIPPGSIRALQVNLVRSHACGVGAPLATPVVRAMLLLRANSLAKGYSGVRPKVVEALCALLNRGVHPIVPSQGSVGASGDLAPLAHLALVLIGEGEAEVGGKRMPGAVALRQTGLRPLLLEAKEGLSLLNGTQAMLAAGILSLLAAERLVESAEVVGAMSLEALRGTPVAFDARLQDVRGQQGQKISAARLRSLIAGSQIRRSHLHCGRVQDAYSLRCMPQVHGAVRDTLAFVRATFEAEANAAVDNPLVFATPNGGEVLSGGNFHGEPLAFALDYVAIVLASLAGISERRVERLVNPALSESLPAFLAPDPGLHSGLMMAQVTAAALVAENRVLAHPASVDSVPTSANKEDYVSMGMGAALKLQQVVANTAHVLGIELIAAIHALAHLVPLRPGRRLQLALARAQAEIAPLLADRVQSGDMARAQSLVLSGALNAAFAPKKR
ncbi:MAG TPA: histidine ammonia-lyase [Terriglobales bacterium]|nr:histidine ammonia-lyase [Terriglobales bacterium]